MEIGRKPTDRKGELEMARVNVVKKAAKYQGKCEICGKEINAGDPYKWVKPRFGHKRIR